jgi:hypothetical protein
MVLPQGSPLGTPGDFLLRERQAYHAAVNFSRKSLRLLEGRARLQFDGQDFSFYLT